MWQAALIALALVAGGCVSAFPEEVLRSVDRSLTLAELRRDPGAHAGRRVILAGEILATRPKTGETEIEVLGRRLRADDSPERSDRSDGRFLVRTAEFLDPAVYAAERRVTVVGTVTGHEERTIGELPFRYPVIAAGRILLWPRDLAVLPPPYPFYYPPYYPFPFHDWPYPYRRFGRPSWPY